MDSSEQPLHPVIGCDAIDAKRKTYNVVRRALDGTISLKKKRDWLAVPVPGGSHLRRVDELNLSNAMKNVKLPLWAVALENL